MVYTSPSFFVRPQVVAMQVVAVAVVAILVVAWLQLLLPVKVMVVVGTPSQPLPANAVSGSSARSPCTSHRCGAFSYRSQRP